MISRLFLAVFLFFVCLSPCLKALSIDSIKVLSWNMGSGYCKSGQSYPNCDGYIVASTDKVISLSNRFDILCFQEFPKYAKERQKDTASKLVNDFILTNKYSVLRKQNSEIAILSKFPVEEMGEIDLSSHYGSQRIKFTLGSKKIQVVNTHNPWSGIVADLNTRKEDVAKTLRWMSSDSNRADLNILAGDFNMNYLTVEELIKSVKPFGSQAIPNRRCQDNIDCIYVWGDSPWVFDTLEMSSQDHRHGITYTYPITSSYTPNRAVTIEGVNSRLAVNGIVSGYSYQWAFFGTPSYIGNSYRYKFILETFPSGQVRISCPFDSVSYLSLNSQISSYTWAFWGSWKYLQGGSYQKDPRFTYDSYSTNLKATYGQTGYLSPNGQVSSWQWAFFGTDAYISASSSKYNKVIYIKDV